MSSVGLNSARLSFAIALWTAAFRSGVSSRWPSGAAKTMFRTPPCSVANSDSIRSVAFWVSDPGSRTRRAGCLPRPRRARRARDDSDPRPDHPPRIPRSRASSATARRSTAARERAAPLRAFSVDVSSLVVCETPLRVAEAIIANGPLRNIAQRDAAARDLEIEVMAKPAVADTNLHSAPTCSRAAPRRRRFPSSAPSLSSALRWMTRPSPSSRVDAPGRCAGPGRAGGYQASDGGASPTLGSPVRASRRAGTRAPRGHAGGPRAQARGPASRRCS